MNKTTFNFDDVANKPTAIFVIARDENKSLKNEESASVDALSLY